MAYPGEWILRLFINDKQKQQKQQQQQQQQQHKGTEEAECLHLLLYVDIHLLADVRSPGRHMSSFFSIARERDHFTRERDLGAKDGIPSR